MTMEEWFEFQVPGKVICAEHCVASIGLEMDKLGGRKVLVVTDEGVEKAGLVRVVIEGMDSGTSEVVGVFNEVTPDSGVDIVHRCHARARSAGADALISVGGGSSIDTAKATALLMVEGGDLPDHQRAVYLPSGPVPPHISVPTTAGSGSESTFAAAILDKDQGLKLIFQGPDLAPGVAMLDPVMTRTLPPPLTASTGMDALTHCIEALHSQMHEPICDGLAVHGIRLIAENLPVAVEHGEDIDARKNMLIAANMGGIAFANAFMGIVHAMAHSLGGHCGVPHGVANSILLPYGMEFNMRRYPEAVANRYRWVAEALGIDISHDDDKTAVARAVEGVRELTSKIGLPQKLSDVGVTGDCLGQVTEDALLDGSMFNNPGEPGYDEVLEVFRQAL